jgi:D-serine deaminase-like pyridoxal phosphate-dependent protein
MRSVSDLDTPAVTVRVDLMEDNIRRVQARLDARGIGNRPHIKTHKIPAIGHMQMAAGAVGITCQKLGEVEVFVDAGVADDVLLTYNVLGRSKAERLMSLIPRVRSLTVVLDNEPVARGLSEAAAQHGATVRFLVDCDTGMGRTGVQTPEAALELARAAMRLPHMEFRGLMTFPNKDPDTRLFFERALELFGRAGIAVPVVSGGGTPALMTVERFPMLTEHRAGTCVYNDAMVVSAGGATWDQCAMRVRTTVVSRPTADRAVLDAGSKVLTSDQYFMKGFGHVMEYPEAAITHLSEEHAVVDLSACPERPQIGDVVEVVPNHCCVVTNMVDDIYGVRGGPGANGVVEVIWPVAARGLVR